MFFFQVELFFRFNADRFANKEYKVLFAGLYLQRPAFEYFNTFLQDFLNNDSKDRNNTINVITQNFSHFKERMRQLFDDFDKEHTIEHKMQVPRQTGSAAKYSSKFQ